MEDVVLFCQVYMEFLSNSNGCTATLGTNMIEDASKIELYFILAMLENLYAGIGHFKSQNDII